MIGLFTGQSECLTERGVRQCWDWSGSSWRMKSASEEPNPRELEPFRPPETNLSLPGCAEADTADSEATHTEGAKETGWGKNGMSMEK